MPQGEVPGQDAPLDLSNTGVWWDQVGHGRLLLTQTSPPLRAASPMLRVAAFAPLMVC